MVNIALSMVDNIKCCDTVYLKCVSLSIRLEQQAERTQYENNDFNHDYAALGRNGPNPVIVLERNARRNDAKLKDIFLPDDWLSNR